MIIEQLLAHRSQAAHSDHRTKLRLPSRMCTHPFPPTLSADHPTFCLKPSVARFLPFLLPFMGASTMASSSSLSASMSDAPSALLLAAAACPAPSLGASSVAMAANASAASATAPFVSACRRASLCCRYWQHAHDFFFKFPEKSAEMLSRNLQQQVS